jgi:hypothetical protein
MPRRSAKWLVKAVMSGEWTLDSAIEEQLHENYQGRLDLPPYSTVNLALCYWNMGWRDRQVNFWDESMTVAEIITEFGLEPFLPLLDRQENVLVQRGDLVIYDNKMYQVIGRREVSPFAERLVDDFEVFIEALDGSTFDFVEESSVDKIKGEKHGLDDPLQTASKDRQPEAGPPVS